MSERIHLGPRDDLVAKAADLLPQGQNDLSMFAVVFPGKRPAHFLRRELSRRIGGSLRPPKIFSIEEFVDDIVEKAHGAPARPLEQLDAAAVLFDLHRELPERLGGDTFLTLDAFLPIGLKLFHELEELRQSGTTEKRIVEALQSIAFDQRHTLAAYYRAFYARVAERGYTTRAMRFAEAADRLPELPLDEYERIIATGQIKLTGTEQRIIDELQRRDHVVMLFQKDSAAPDDPRPSISFTTAPDVHGQVFALAARLRERLEHPETLNERTVIVLPADDALFPLIQHVLAGIPEERYNIAFQYPLSRTPVNGFLTALLELLRTRQAGAFAAAAYVRFILHPYTKNIRLSSRSDVTRMLMHALEDELAGDRSRPFVRLEELEALDEVFTRIAFSASADGDPVTPDDVRGHLRFIHDHTIRPLMEIGSVSALARGMNGILSTVYDDSTAHLHPLFRPYADTILQEFVRLEHSLIGSASFASMDGYVEFVRHIVDQLRVPFPGTPLRGLQVLGVLETRGLRFDHVYMLQVQDEELPGGMGADMLLPQMVREKLGLETIKDRDELSEYYFRVLTSGAETVDLFFSESGGSSRSRFAEKLLWERQQRDGEPRSERYVASVRPGIRLTNDRPSPIDKTPAVVAAAKRLKVSASALDSYLHCGLQFYYRHILRLREQEEVAADVDARDIGTFIHRTLSAHFAPFVGRILPPEALDPTRIEAVVDEHFVGHFGRASAGALALLRNQVRIRLRDLLVKYQRAVCERTDVRLLGVEQKLEVRAFGAALVGTLDRVEERGRETVILDYKTGIDGAGTRVRFSALDLDQRETWDDAIGSLQLPFYQLLLSEAWHVDPSVVLPAYLFLGAAELSPEAEVPLSNEPADRLGRYQTLRGVIERLIGEIGDPSMPFHPTMDLSARCPSCPFSGICGTQWVQGGARG